jgi:FMN phosphatase YigB (HAD superfamily)
MTLMKGELWEAFHENPPTILPEIVEQLQRLKDEDITLSIGSNTNFIPGHVIRDAVLDKLNVFNFFVFSDEAGCSKPNGGFFSSIYYKSYSMNGRNHVLKKNVVHIGDSDDFDYTPASECGFNAVHIRSPYELSTILKRY